MAPRARECKPPRSPGARTTSPFHSTEEDRHCPVLRSSFLASSAVARTRYRLSSSSTPKCCPSCRSPGGSGCGILMWGSWEVSWPRATRIANPTSRGRRDLSASRPCRAVRRNLAVPSTSAGENTTFQYDNPNNQPPSVTTFPASGRCDYFEYIPCRCLRPARTARVVCSDRSYCRIRIFRTSGGRVRPAFSYPLPSFSFWLLAFLRL